MNAPAVFILGHSNHPPTAKLTRILTQMDVPHDVVKIALGEALPDLDAVRGLIILGAPTSTYNLDDNPWLVDEMKFVEQALAKALPMFGICFGCQMLAQIGGGRVHQGEQGREFGFTKVESVGDGHALAGLHELRVFQAHGDTYTLPETAKTLLKGEVYVEQGAQFAENVYGVQFHPEITPDVIQKWHTKGVELGWPHAVNHPLTPQNHALAASPLLNQTDRWLQGFLGELFKA